MTLGKIVAIGSGTVSIIGGIVGGMMWLSSQIVWASDYQDQEQTQTEIMLEMRIDILQDRIDRINDPEAKKIMQQQVDRMEKQLEKLQDPTK